MKKIIIVCCMLTVIFGCGNKKSNIIPEGNDAPETEDIAVKTEQQNSADPEVITERVKAIYEAVAAAYPEVHDISPSNDVLDDTYCSSEWNTLVQMVNAKDAEKMGKEAFFDSDYWIMGQDWGELSVSDIKVFLLKGDSAAVEFQLHNLGNMINVVLDMVHEDGEWKIDNFTDITNGMDWKATMKRYLEDEQANR